MMKLPSILILYGEDATLRRAVGNSLADRHPDSLLWGFEVPIREAFKATFSIPEGVLLEAKEVARFGVAYRALLREIYGREILAKLLADRMLLRATHPHLIIEDGSKDYHKEIRWLALQYTDDVAILNLSSNPRLTSHDVPCYSLSDFNLESPSP